jgi:NADH dehydrogenase
VIFLTGGSGYVGQRLLARLAARGERVRCLVLPGDPVDLAARFPVEVVRGDLLDAASLETAGEGVTAVVHGAALMLPNAKERIRAVNVDGTANLLQAVRAWGARRFVYMSAVSAVYKAVNSYGRSKADAERLVRESGLDYTILRPTMVYGEGGGLHFAKLVGTLRKLPLVVPIVGSGGARLQPVWVEDLVTAIETVLASPRAVGRAYNVSGATVVRFDEFLDLIFAMTGLRRVKLRVPLWLCKAGAHTLAAVLPSSFVSPEAILGLSQNADLDFSEFRDECGYQPVTLDVGLRKAFGRA